MPASTEKDRSVAGYVGTIVGESTSREFRLALAREAVREQDIIAVDAELRGTDNTASVEKIRVWAKVQRIERVNPLFPQEAGHELAATQTHPLDTVLSLSREMVTAVCQVLGAEPLEGIAGGRLDHLRAAHTEDVDGLLREGSPDVPQALEDVLVRHGLGLAQ